MSRDIRWSVAVALLLGGCAVGPDYHPPELPAPAQWSEPVTAPEAAIGNERAWWTRFHDPILDALVDEALAANLDLKQAQARIAQSRADLTIAGAPAYPSLDASGSATRSRASASTATSTTTSTSRTVKPISTTYKAGFDSSWELDLFGGIERAIEASEARLEAQIDDAGAIRVTLLGDVVGNYVALRENQEQVAIARRNGEAQRSTAEVTRERYRLGLTSYLDVAQAEAQWATTKSTLPTYELAAKQAIHRLSVLSGRDPAALKARLETPAPLPPVESLAVRAMPSDLLRRRPDLRREERRLAAASADIGVASADLYPRFDIAASLGFQSSSRSAFTDKASRTWSLAPGLKLPLFDGGTIRANIDAKQAKFEEAHVHYQDAFNKALEEVENALAGLTTEASRRIALTESVKASEIAVELARNRYGRGLTSILDVLTAERTLYAAQSSLSQAEANLATHAVSLYKALGGGWE